MATLLVCEQCLTPIVVKYAVEQPICMECGVSFHVRLARLEEQREKSDGQITINYLTEARYSGSMKRVVHNLKQTGNWMPVMWGIVVQWQGYVRFFGSIHKVTGWTSNDVTRIPHEWDLEERVEEQVDVRPWTNYTHKEVPETQLHFLDRLGYT